MKRITAAAAATAVAAQCLLQGCVSEYGSTEKLRDLEFQVVSEEDAPEELRSAIDEAQEKPYQIIYAEQDTLWIAEGYGKKDTSGYSVGIRELYETEDAVHVRASLLGPGKGEKILETATYPCVIVRTEYVDKEVLFD